VQNESESIDAEQLRALERLAYGPTSSGTEALRAQRELQDLRSPAPSSEPAVPVELEPEAPNAGAMDFDDPPLPARRLIFGPQRWAIGIAVIVAVGAVGFAAGQRTQTSASPASTTASATRPGAAAAVASSTRDPADPNNDRVVFSQTTVQGWFGMPQRAADRLPPQWQKYGKSLSLPTSRLADVDRQLDKLWVVKEKAPNTGYCLIEVSHAPHSSITSDLTCATTLQFLQNGLLTSTWSGGIVDWSPTDLTIRTSL
jgi:hypothetical protein